MKMKERKAREGGKRSERSWKMENRGERGKKRKNENGRERRREMR